MAGDADMTRWQQLGQLLEQRRGEIDPRYANLTAFTSERGLDYRLCWDLEHGRRDNYRRLTLSAVEVGYMLEPGVIDAFIAGESETLAAATNPYAGDPALADVWEKSRGLANDARHGLVALARQMRDGKGNGARHSGGEDKAGDRLRRA